MRWSSCQQSCWNSVPASCNGKSKARRRPARYSSSWRRASSIRSSAFSREGQWPSQASRPSWTNAAAKPKASWNRSKCTVIWSLELPHQADDDALDPDVAGRDADRLHGGVRRLEPDHLPFGEEALERGVVADQGDHHLAGLGDVAAEHDDEVAVVDPLLDHRVAHHAQDVVVA